MASSEDFPEICAVCQEEYDRDLPREQLSLVRPSECPLHFVHKDCGMPWFRKHRNCVVCLKPSIEIVDICGKTVACIPASSGAPLANASQMSYAENMDIYGPERFFFLQRHEQLSMTRDFLRTHVLPLCDEELCQLCSKTLCEDDRAVVIPCNHQFHHSCLASRLSAIPLCLVSCPSCSCPAAAIGDPSGKHDVMYLNPLCFAFVLYADQLPKPQEQPPTATVCQFCDANAENEARVITPCCHVFHRRCFDEQAGDGLESVRVCPKRGCGKTCINVIPIQPQQWVLELREFWGPTAWPLVIQSSNIQYFFQLLSLLFFVSLLSYCLLSLLFLIRN